MDERPISAMSRITLSVQNMIAVTEFYRDVLRLKPIFDLDVQPPQWIEFNTGPCRLALQVAEKVDGVPSTYSKIVFYVADVEEARRELVERGAPMGDIEDDGRFLYCDGHDPEGNKFQISNRPS